MKKIFYCTLSIALLTVALASCAKSTKRKIANQWKVTAFSQTETDVDSYGHKTVTTTTMTENTVTETVESTPDGGSTFTSTTLATVNANEMTIEKDGTWTSTRDVTVSGTGFTQQTISTANGTWSFVGKMKGEDFKKNERVMFNTLSETDKTITITGDSTVESGTSTYLTGENVMVYTVKESKRKKLQLESEIDHTYTSDYYTNSTKRKRTITLAEK